MKLATKLPLAFISILLMMVIGALVGIYQLNGVTDRYATTVQESNDNQQSFQAIAVTFKVQVQEWKDTLLRGRNPTDLKKHWAAFAEREREVKERTKTLLELLPVGESRDLLQKFAREHETLGEEYRASYEKFASANFDPTVGDTAVRGKDREPVRLLAAAGDKIAEHRVAISNAARADGRKATILSLVAMLVTFLAGGSAGLLISRSVLRQLGGEPNVATDLAAQIAQGNLSQQLLVSPGDTTSLIAQLKVMQESLERVVGRVRRNAESVSQASAEIAQGNNDLSGRTEEQASALEQTSASMQELGSNVRHNAENSKAASQLAHESSALVTRGGEVVGKVVETMKGINESSKRIADIISVIDGIAFQTNILALNAAVEAARAGEQGRGFAVVASEVRTLAQRSAEAAKEIKSMITASVERVEEGTLLVDEAGATMTKIVESIQRVANILNEISQASAEQSASVAEISQAVSQMDQVTQQNAALVEESAAAADGLRQQAQDLMAEVAIFRLEDRFAEANGQVGNSIAASTRDSARLVANPDAEAARNVVRPAFGAKKVVGSQVASRTGTDDWEEF